MIYFVIGLFAIALISFLASYMVRVQIFARREANPIFRKILDGVPLSALNDGRFIDLFRARKDLSGNDLGLVKAYAATGILAIVCTLGAGISAFYL